MGCPCKNKQCLLSQKETPIAAPGALFQTGQIKRVRFWNFMGYKYSVVYVIPILNLMFDPTDDSSMGNALLVCFGCTPAHLKLKSLGDLVRPGATHFTVEAILVNENGKPDIVIERSYEKNSGKSFWEIDGKEAQSSDVTAIMTKLGLSLVSFVHSSE